MLHYLEAAERTAEPIVLKPVSRRMFLGGTAAGLALAAFPAAAFEPYPHGGQQMANGIVADPLVFVAIDRDGTVTITAHRSEMGTGVRTSLPMVLADEMEADWDKVTIWQAPGDEPKYGNQDTDGSRSLRHHIQSMRQIGASVRKMLASAAAQHWGLGTGETIEQWGGQTGLVAVENHAVRNVSTGEELGFGELAESWATQPVPKFEELSFKTEDQFRYIGKGEIALVDMRDITTGTAIYGADVTLPGMKYAVIARPPVVGGKAKSVDDQDALKVAGVEKTLPVPVDPWTQGAKFAPLGGVAVIASNTWAAIAGRDALRIEWEDGPNASYESEAFRKTMSETATKPGKVLREEGDVDDAFRNADRMVEREYYQAHLAHAPMEPPVALAHVQGDRAEIWAPVQSPYGTRKDVAEALGVPVENVTVNVTLLGGGFGRKSKCDYAIEAALLSRETGAPVRVQWTREDDIRHSFLHTTSVERIEASVDKDGRVTGWRHNSVAPTISSTFAEGAVHHNQVEMGMGHVDLPFEIANLRLDNGPAEAHARIGWYRSVSNVPHAFAVQTFAAELAEELGRDQKEVLLELIGSDRTLEPGKQGFPEDFWNYGEPYDEFPIDTGRLRHVLEVAADAAGWGKDLPDGEGLGLAVHRSFVTYVGTAARVRILEDGTITVPEIHMAVDCGFCANPERVRSQMEGACVMGMTHTLLSAVTFDQGRVQQSNYHDYGMVRADNFPRKVVTHIVEHPFSVHATGIGEPGVPPVAPAIGNAIFNATGKRLRDLPFGPTI